MKTNRKTLFESLHIFALAGFAVAQPVYDILGKNADFFVFRRSAPEDVIILSAVLSMLIPLCLVAVKYIISLLNDHWEKLYHGFIIFFLLLLLFLQVLKRLDMPVWYLVIFSAIVLSSLAAFAYFRYDPMRLFFTILSPTAVIFPAIFLLSSSVFSITSSLEASRGISVGSAARPPVILIVFDEFPVISLLDKDLKIDPARYHNFAEFAKSSYWFRNATTVHNLTDVAVPAILTGRYPALKKKLSIFSEYPENLFTLLSGNYESINAFETATRLCPASLCKTSVTMKPAGTRIPDLIGDTGVIYLLLILPTETISSIEWLNRRGNEIYFWSKIDAANSSQNNGRHDYNPLNIKNQSSARRNQFHEFLKSITGKSGSMYFLHTLLPHIPFEYLPSGKRYSDELIMPGWDWQKDQWGDDEVTAIQAYRRHLLQVEYTDRLLGELIADLKRKNIYDESLIIITADHGISFVPGQKRRSPEQNTLHEITNIPLFIKLPGQKKGVVDDGNTETIDIVPTVASILGIHLPWKVDGISALDKNIKKDGKFISGTQFQSSPSLLSPYIDRKYELFGSGITIRNYDPVPNANMFVGRRSGEFSKKSQNEVSLALEKEKMFQNIDLNSNFIPVYIKGSLNGKEKISHHSILAVSVNGIIQSVTQTFGRTGKKLNFTAMVPESSFKSGMNAVEIYIIESEKGRYALQPVPALPGKK